jgi:hypothetical protein
MDVVQQHPLGIPSMDNDLDLLTPDEAATVLKVSVVTLRRWISRAGSPLTIRPEEAENQTE